MKVSASYVARAGAQCLRENSVVRANLNRATALGRLVDRTVVDSGAIGAEFGKEQMSFPT